ncbi:MAG: hypothetical protein HC903_25855 [Methylacidiphilales bacterium]|nr:hypothetical protein [Candidatus Methylacidiphilales bacterium]NJR15757.1 hypothetical protein [Calothrix sp. CSU_2_0]
MLRNDFGFYHIELDTDKSLKREITAAALVYRQIAEQHTVQYRVFIRRGKRLFALYILYFIFYI